LAGFMPILMMLVVIVPFWLMMSRRQKKETQARAAEVSPFEAYKAICYDTRATRRRRVGEHGQG